VQQAVYWQFKWCTDYCMQYSAIGGVLTVQVIYRLLHAVEFTWRCIDGSSDLQITACSTVQLAVYWRFKRCTDYCMQYSATCGVLTVQVMYRFLHAAQCNWLCIDCSIVVQITACNAVYLAVWWWFKWCREYCMQYSANGFVLKVQMMYRLLHAVQCNCWCIDGSSDVQNTACSRVQLAVCWLLEWCTAYCMQYGATGGVLMVQEMYRLLHEVQCNWRCIDGSSHVQNTAYNTVQLAVYWRIKWCKVYCMHYSATGGVLMVQVMYRILHACSATGGVLMVQVMYILLHAVQCNKLCIVSSSDVLITACSTVQLAVYWRYRWYTDYCMQYSAPGGVSMVQVIYRLLHAV